MFGGVPLVAGPSAALDLVLVRLFGALVETIAAADFLCLIFVIAWEVESVASSPEASREDGCDRSAVDDCLFGLVRVELRFRLPDPDEEGDDMVT